MFNRILVANRGEIAVRIMRACRELGIRTTAIFAEPDAGSPFVRHADDSVPLGGSKLSETYLDIGKVLGIAEKTGAEAIHPGYGLLSENPAFAGRARRPGSPSRDLVRKIGLPIIPGSEGIVHRVEDAIEVAEGLGYPVI